MSIKKLFIPLFCCALLCGCSIRAGVLDENDITDSNTNSSSQTTQLTSTPKARAVDGAKNYSKSKVVWGAGNITDHKQPIEPKTLDERYSSLNAHWLLKEKNKVCLTFDEGYENGYTPSILDTLKDKKVSAIFFVTYDFAKDNPDLVRRMIKEGHIVANHTYRHYTMDEVSEELAREEIEYLHKYIEDEFGYTMSLFRFPKGEFSEQTLSLVKDEGYQSVFWSFAYADWDPDAQMNTRDAFEHICRSTHPGEIILLHAVSKTNAAILPDVIDNIREQGYEFSVKI